MAKTRITLSELDKFYPSSKPRVESPQIRHDYTKGEFIKFRMGKEFGELSPLIRHYIPGVGYVNCNQQPYKKQDGTYGLKGYGEFECEFCKRRREFKEAMNAKAASEGRKVTIEEGKEIKKFMQRYISLPSPVEAMVLKKNPNIKDPSDPPLITVKEQHMGTMLFKAQDMFFTQVKQHYSTLKGVLQTKPSIMNNWFVLTTSGDIMMDDPITDADRERTIVGDITFYDKQTKTYEDGLRLYYELDTAKKEAVPYEKEEKTEQVF